MALQAMQVRLMVLGSSCKGINKNEDETAPLNHEEIVQNFCNINQLTDCQIVMAPQLKVGCSDKMASE